MPKMTERFQRAALIAEAARLESYINQQLDLTYRVCNDLPLNTPSHLSTKFRARYQKLGECREAANELRKLIWDLD